MGSLSILVKFPTQKLDFGISKVLDKGIFLRLIFAE